METGEIRRNDHYFPALAEPFKGLEQTLAQVAQYQPVLDGSAFEIQHKFPVQLIPSVSGGNEKPFLTKPDGFAK
jgi:hypothetical protein